MNRKAHKSQKKSERTKFRRNRRKKNKEQVDDRVLKGKLEWDDDESSRTDERILPPGEEHRKKVVISHDDVLDEGVHENASSAEAVMGQVIEIHGQWSIVQIGDDEVRCRLRGKLRELAINQRSILAVGDIVGVEEAAENEGHIVEILPRKNELSRQSLGHRHMAHVVAANIDQMLIVGSVTLPDLWPEIIDRYLVASHARNFVPLIVINKQDLDSDGIGEETLEDYQSIGYPALMVSAQTGHGMEELRSHLSGKVSIFIGQSGVGKSTLLNFLEPSLELKIGEVGETTRRGRHTTTTTRLIRLSPNTYVVDTPGVRDFNPFQLEPEEIHDGFLEISEAAKDCRFPNCRHDLEPDCAVLAAVDAGEILARRYLSFRNVFDRA